MTHIELRREKRVQARFFPFASGLHKLQEEEVSLFDFHSRSYFFSQLFGRM